MTTKREIDEFLAQKTLAIVGVSRSGKKFGNTILKDLTKLGYRLLPVHPEATEVDGIRAFPSFAALPEPVGGVIVCVPPSRAESVVKEAAAHGMTPSVAPAGRRVGRGDQVLPGERDERGGRGVRADVSEARHRVGPRRPPVDLGPSRPHAEVSVVRHGSTVGWRRPRGRGWPRRFPFARREDRRRSPRTMETPDRTRARRLGGLESRPSSIARGSARA